MRAAKLLEISYRALLYKIKDAGLDRERRGRAPGMSADTLRRIRGSRSQRRGASGLDRIATIWRRRKWLGDPGVCPAADRRGGDDPGACPISTESTALVLVERQQVPEAFVRPTVTSELETRLHTISQEILSRSRLEALITRMGLYPDLQGPGPERRGRQAHAPGHPARAEGAPMRAGGRAPRPPSRFPTAGADPQTVAVVTNTLASFYIEENLKARERQATGTAEFLQVQLVEAKKRLDEQEARNERAAATLSG